MLEEYIRLVFCSLYGIVLMNWLLKGITFLPHPLHVTIGSEYLGCSGHDCGTGAYGLKCLILFVHFSLPKTFLNAKFDLFGILKCQLATPILLFGHRHSGHCWAGILSLCIPVAMTVDANRDPTNVSSNVFFIHPKITNFA